WGRGVGPAGGGVGGGWRGDNTSYKRDILLAYGAELETLLKWESVLQRDLRVRGYELYLEPASKTRHVSVSRFSSFALQAFHKGRQFGTDRAQSERWSMSHRLFRVAGAPLVPLVYFRRLWKETRRRRRHLDLLPRILPAATARMVMWAAGEAVGYLFGAGNAPLRGQSYEFDRHQYLAPSDREALSGR